MYVSSYSISQLADRRPCSGVTGVVVYDRSSCSWVTESCRAEENHEG